MKGLSHYLNFSIFVISLASEKSLLTNRKQFAKVKKIGEKVSLCHFSSHCFN